ncbi:hypothetical protein [Actinopolymorpha rutila]|uniref:Uncharacterized protein n=1 Tax=Actinopolymorpha rutila TaxID=446787 RepID=A0A852ZKT3_9ACTN|nr:hypothetical protein [Actinopolymorpha rutila]NYH89810.1 hypothetical protein [Actinopolymorpha rutila]
MKEPARRHGADRSGHVSGATDPAARSLPLDPGQEALRPLLRARFVAAGLTLLVCTAVSFALSTLLSLPG